MHRQAVDLQNVIQHVGDVEALLKAIAHPTRLTIMFLLSEGEATVSWIEKELAINQAMVSQHLARLQADGLVACRRVGRNSYYRVATTDITALLHLLLEMFPDKSGTSK